MAGFNVVLDEHGMHFVDHEPEYIVGIDVGRDDSVIVLEPVDKICRLPDVDALLELINEGAYDEHLEAILAAGHARKRERRGVRHPYGVPR